MIITGSRLRNTRGNNIDVMIDTETLGKSAGAAVLSIGAVAFDPYAPFPALDSSRSMIADNQFYACVSLESCREIGLFSDPQTEQWWSTQSPEAVEAAFGGTTLVREAAEGLLEWLRVIGGTDERGVPQVSCWSHGASFDLPIVGEIFIRLRLGEFMPYNGGRDTRTVFDMARHPYKGTKHHALMDSIDQAEAVHAAMAKIGLTSEA